MTPSEFARAARTLAATCRTLGVVAPSYRCPPKHPTADRTLRVVQGRPIVAVRIRGRERDAVLVDLIAGTVEANRDGVGPAGMVPLADALNDALDAE